MERSGGRSTGGEASARALRSSSVIPWTGAEHVECTTQVVVVNYEDKHTTMEAPDDQDEISYRCCFSCSTCWCFGSAGRRGCCAAAQSERPAAGVMSPHCRECKNGRPIGMILARRYLMNITIPAAFITKSDGQVLKDMFKKTGASPAEDVYIVMDWNDVLPHAQKVRTANAFAVTLVAACADVGACVLARPQQLCGMQSWRARLLLGCMYSGWSVAHCLRVHGCQSAGLWCSACLACTAWGDNGSMSPFSSQQRRRKHAAEADIVPVD